MPVVASMWLDGRLEVPVLAALDRVAPVSACTLQALFLGLSLPLGRPRREQQQRSVTWPSVKEVCLAHHWLRAVSADAVPIAPDPGRAPRRTPGWLQGSHETRISGNMRGDQRGASSHGH